MNAKNLPLRETKCGTCPFRPGSKYAKLADDLAASALNDCSRVCHSTGTNAIGGKTGIKSHLCRGARDVQLNLMALLKVIDEPTDEAWNEKRVECGMKPTVVKDPGEK